MAPVEESSLSDCRIRFPASPPVCLSLAGQTLRSPWALLARAAECDGQTERPEVPAASVERAAFAWD
eukprot:CAMPEP_0184462300 /NCGR_PEP_ID=MMETSP0740-20130409/47682_1 /TAXON_ID=385413 /ORGANISM="Thalassiosira miniscula, Strain CCMP1093" /LENGTH=66 /DNA_ID=CAMNT_0026836189 /DNA_START=17 /DNA_END=214 /DNA_ORIENTATION=-